MRCTWHLWRKFYLFKLLELGFQVPNFFSLIKMLEYAYGVWTLKFIRDITVFPFWTMTPKQHPINPSYNEYRKILNVMNNSMAHFTLYVSLIFFILIQWNRNIFQVIDESKHIYHNCVIYIVVLMFFKYTSYSQDQTTNKSIIQVKPYFAANSSSMAFCLSSFLNLRFKASTALEFTWKWEADM